MERDILDNNPGAPLQHQDTGFSSGTSLEANAFVQEASPSVAAEQSLPPSMLSMGALEGASSAAAEASMDAPMMDMEVRAPEEMSLVESCQRDEIGHPRDLRMQGLEEERAGVEVMTSALCLWQGERGGASVLDDPRHELFEPAAMYVPRELPPMREVRNYLALDEGRGNREFRARGGVWRPGTGSAADAAACRRRSEIGRAEFAVLPRAQAATV